MIGHEAVRVTLPAIAVARRAQEREEALAVVVIAIDRPASVTACGDVVK